MLQVLDSLNVAVANSVNQLGITEAVTIKEHHLLPDIFSEEESGPEEDTPEAVQVFAEYGKPLQVGEFYLTRSKPYLSSAVSHINCGLSSVYLSLNRLQT